MGILFEPRVMCVDGYGLLAGAHTGPDSEALSYADNQLSADLSESVLQTALIQFEKVKEGVLDVTGRLFGVTYRRVTDTPVWHPAVECWDVLGQGKLIGRFYFDMHPRENKYNHAAQFGVRTGVRGVQIPEAVLVCNFPGGDPGDPGLMEYDDVQTFFHEFGHLLHNIFAGEG